MHLTLLPTSFHWYKRLADISMGTSWSGSGLQSKNGHRIGAVELFIDMIKVKYMQKKKSIHYITHGY